MLDNRKDQAMIGQESRRKLGKAKIRWEMRLLIWLKAILRAIEIQIVANHLLLTQKSLMKA